MNFQESENRVEVLKSLCDGWRYLLFTGDRLIYTQCGYVSKEDAEDGAAARVVAMKRGQR